MRKQLSKTIIGLDGVVQQPITFTSITHNLGVFDGFTHIIIMLYWFNTICFKWYWFRSTF